ncbi:hypothetical protein [Caminicella sporogenes]|uniref:hypothetical protein n=1 Tax=Caminicella sporogenes TaxID=166485 RepID=UPI0025407D88|nr:hypothetical protein [Caminicella sporogenes]WIF94637.1 hypothetical protein QNI18_10275 [Caminicella sporogenes]
MATVEEKNKQGIGIGKILLIVFIVFFIIPMTILAAIYYTNENFKMEANKYLSKLPGAVGDYFENYPTKEEINNQIHLLANYLIKLDDNRAVDKLNLIKSKDQKAFNDIIKLMYKANSIKTKKILDSMRNNSMKTNLLKNILVQIEKEEDNEIISQAKYIESLSTIIAVNKIKSDIVQNKISYKDLAKIFENMDEEKAAELLRYIDSDVKDEILDDFTSIQARNSISMKINELKDKQLQLKNLSDIYSIESPANLVKILGNTKTYKMEELAEIYRNIGVLKTAQILSNLEDNKFIFELINSIKEKEILLKGKDTVTDDILKAIKVYRQFNNNVKELTAIYEKMDEKQIAELIKRMIRNSGKPVKYVLGNGNTISFTDEDIAINVLKNFNEKKVASILSYLDSNLSSEISKKLAIPVP